MIHEELLKVVETLRYNGVPPVALFNMQQMENYEADKVPEWFVLIPIVQDVIRVDQLSLRSYNLRCVFAKVNHHQHEMNEGSQFYYDIFGVLIREQKKFLLRIEGAKDTSGTRLFTIRTTDIVTNYRAQDTYFSVPCTTIEFTLQLVMYNYESQCT